MNLSNKIIAVIGSNGKIGSCFVNKIIEKNGFVVQGDIKKNNKKLKNAIFFNVDITKERSVNNFFKRIFAKFGRIDAVVNCSYPKSNKWGQAFEKLNENNLKDDLCNQLGGAIILSKVALFFFKKNNKGNLIHLSSIQGLMAPKFDHYIGTKMVSPIEYSAIKSGIISITKYLAKYCKNMNIRVNCISPGGIKNNQPTKFLKKYKSNCVSKGILDPIDIWGALLYLLSDESKFVTGQNIIVDDGWSL